MKLKLISAEYENFKGIRSLSVDFSDKTDIFWRNKGGKTSLLDGVNWCLFGKDSHNNAEFDIKTKIGGKVQHHLDHRVLINLEVDGEVKSFERIYKEVWNKKKVLKSHTTDYAIDDSPKSATVYNKTISELIDKSVFRMLTDPRYFNEEMEVEERRNILKELSDKLDVATVDGYKKIELFLNKMTLKEQRKVFKLEITKLEDKIAQIPPAIRENEDYITDDAKPESRLQQGKLRELQDDYRREIIALKADSGKQSREKRIAEIDTEILNKKNSLDSDKRQKLGPIADNIEAKKSKINRARISVDELHKKINSGKREISLIEFEQNQLRKSWEAINGQKSDVQSHCPTCQQQIPLDSIQTTTEKFNLQKAESLQDIRNKGQALGKRIDEIKVTFTAFESEIKEKEEKIPIWTQQIHDLEAEQTQINSITVDTAELELEKNGLLKANKEITPVDTSELDSKIQTIDDEIKEEHELLSKVADNEKYKARILELEEQEKDFSQKVLDLESKIFDIDNFVLAESGAIEELVNQKFVFARYSLFKPLINGGAETRCVAIGEDGELYKSVNNAQQAQIGIDTIRTLQKHYNFFAPIWIDNREGITEIPQTDCQVISLYVSPGDEVLRVE